MRLSGDDFERTAREMNHDKPGTVLTDISVRENRPRVFWLL